MQLECRRISFRYPNAAGEVFRDLSFAIEEAGFHALFGPSGVGKTTLVRMIGGLTPGGEGSISGNGSGRVLYSYNLERLPGWASVGEHLAEVSRAAERELLKELIAVCGLEGCIASRFNRLSLGQQNRANLVRYLLQDFGLLILDESLANVDEATRERIILKIKAMFPQRCFLYISHNVVEVAKFCRQILVLRNPAKNPQIVCVTGRDQRDGSAPDPRALERTMLEIVHAA